MVRRAGASQAPEDELSVACTIVLHKGRAYRQIAGKRYRISRPARDVVAAQNALGASFIAATAPFSRHPAAVRKCEAQGLCWKCQQRPSRTGVYGVPCHECQAIITAAGEAERKRTGKRYLFLPDPDVEPPRQSPILSRQHAAQPDDRAARPRRPQLLAPWNEYVDEPGDVRFGAGRLSSDGEGDGMELRDRSAKRADRGRDFRHWWSGVSDTLKRHQTAP